MVCSERRGSTQGPSPSPISTPSSHNFNHIPAASVTPQLDGTPSVTQSDAVQAKASTDAETYAQFMKPKFARAPIKEAGRVAYLGRNIFFGHLPFTRVFCK